MQKFEWLFHTCLEILFVIVPCLSKAFSLAGEKMEFGEKNKCNSWINPTNESQ